MISIVICSISPERLRQVIQNIQGTIGVEYEIIAINNREKCWPIARAYNEGARKARYSNLFFVHEDVKFHSQNWGVIIEEKMREPDCGIIGFAGSKVKFRCYSGWLQTPKMISALLYQREADGTKLEVRSVFKERPFEEVIVLDGLGMFVRREIWSEYPFDEESLTGFHCYDLDFSLQIAASNQYKNYVCCSHKVLIEHFSSGNYNGAWYKDTIRLHKSKWADKLPLKVPNFEISEKERRKYEERCFYHFVHGMLTVNCSEKKMVVKEFLFYSFSWKHLGHCVSIVCKYLKS